MILQHLTSGTRAITLPHRPRPDAPGDSADHRIFRIHAVRKEETQVRREVIDVHAAREVVLDDRKTIRQGKRQLADRIRARFRDVISADRNAVVVANIVFDEELLHVSHHLHRKFCREDAGVLCLVFFENVSLHRATYGGERLAFEFCRRSDFDQLVAGNTKQAKPRPSFPGGRSPEYSGRCYAFKVRVDFFAVPHPTCRFLSGVFDLLIDRGIHEKRQDHRRRAIDRHGYRSCRRFAEIESRIQFLDVVDRSDRHTGIADLAVNIRALVRVSP